MKNSLTNRNFNEMTGGNYFASSDVNPAAMLAEARARADRTSDASAQDQDKYADPRTGTVYSANDPMINSLGKENLVKLDKGNKFATQWYEDKSMLWDAECRAMKTMCPHATLEVLPDKRLSWDITLRGIIDRSGKQHTWVVKFIYDSDHPHNRDYGGSIKVYPISPSIAELDAMAKRAGRKGVPHLWRDAYGNPTLCTAPTSQVRASNRETVTAITVLGWTSDWATEFLMGLTDNDVWARFTQH